VDRSGPCLLVAGRGRSLERVAGADKFAASTVRGRHSTGRSHRLVRWIGSRHLNRRHPRRCVTVCGMAWPTTNNPKTEFVTLRLTVEENDALIAAANAAGMDRSAYVRDCVRRVREADKRKAARLKGRKS